MKRSRSPAAPGVRGFNQLYGTYKHAAKKRGLSFSLTKADVLRLTSDNCAYCGTLPNAAFVVSAHKATRDNSVYIYNGIDRIDNRRGYEADNVVACCVDCNWAKGTRTQDEFVSWLVRAYCRTVLGE